MTEPVFPLTALSEAQRAQALERFTIIRPALEDGVSQAQVARASKKAPSTIRLWIKRYREKGLVGLANHVSRSDKGTSRRLPDTAIRLVEGLALQKPPRSMAAIHRQVTAIAKEQRWKPPSYDRVRHIIKHLDPALVTMAHQGAAAYREEFDLLYRRESPHANAMWQADHTPLDVLLLDETGKPAKPWLTAIEDDYSRAIVGYRLSFQEATTLTTALTLRTAIWRKEDPCWHTCGIPTVFYSDHGSDFTSKHTVKPFLPEPLITYAGRSAIDGLYPYRPFTFASAPLEAPVLESRTVFYTPTPSASAGRIEKEVMTLFASYSYLAEAAHQRHHPSEEFVVTRRYSSLIELLIVDEANRLKDVGLEQIRDIADRGEIGLVLLGMPGLDKRLQRVPQLYSRIGFVHEIVPLSQEETRFFLAQRWSHRVSAHSKDFTDQEAVATIIRITQGNMRLIDRLLKQVERVLVANQLTVVTKEVVETARQNLIIGFE